MTREKMMNEVIRKFGFEASITIEFCEMCENANTKDEILARLFKILIKK